MPFVQPQTFRWRKVMTRLFVSVGLASALICASLGAWAQTRSSDRASQTFITKAIEGNLAEVQMGQLAQEKGAREGVRSFGQTLQQDHAAGAQKATAVATQLGVNPPTEPNKNQKGDARDPRQALGSGLRSEVRERDGQGSQEGNRRVPKGCEEAGRPGRSVCE